MRGAFGVCARRERERERERKREKRPTRSDQRVEIVTVEKMKWEERVWTEFEVE